jgi:gustatory receptor
MWFPWDWTQPIVYELCYALMMWGAFTSCIGNLTSDLLFCTITTLSCVQFNALRFEVKKIVNGKLPKVCLKKWIDDHNELIKIVNDIEGIFSVSLLFDFVGSSLILCLAGFQAVVRRFF